MNLTKRSSLSEVVRSVSMALRGAGIRAVLTGGACASLYSRGRYQSSDLDFVIQSGVTRAQLDAAMAAVDEHPHAVFFVEFPAGPLAIGADIRIEPVDYTIRRVGVAALSATDSCRDRLAAFYHWNDRQALRAALAIARHHKVDLSLIRKWSDGEDAKVAFEEFATALKKTRGRR